MYSNRRKLTCGVGCFMRLDICSVRFSTSWRHLQFLSVCRLPLNSMISGPVAAGEGVCYISRAFGRV
nr:hypothetical protein BMMJLCPH_00011 [Gallid alphaherpesvirus 2]WOL21661.1 hypothetical protein BMMJLCPH_00086 [Gallid alphaherpesvirus 2]